MTLRPGQLLLVCREHFAIDDTNRAIISLYQDDLLLVVETSNGCQGVVVRLEDAARVHIVALPFTLDVLGQEMEETYVEVPVGEIDPDVEREKIVP